MQEALELVCRKRRISDPKDYALLYEYEYHHSIGSDGGKMSILIPLDRTVASLQGKRELVLINKSMLGRYGIKATGRTTDPNGE
jgi:target of rapamycin complex 2 subunit MAPKAP1